MLRVLLVCFLLIVVNAADIPRGVDVQDSGKYLEHHSKNKFVCLDNLKTIDYAQVNDDYCDCADGSDEPGTSACARADRTPTMFYCRNKGFRSKRIFSSFVNDGICDCCDGSDENDGSTECPNTCAEFGASIKQTLEQQIKDLDKGLSIKKKYIERANADLAEKTQSLATKKSQITALQKELDVIVEDKEAKEKVETEQRDALREAKRAQWEEEQANKPPSDVPDTTHQVDAPLDASPAAEQPTEAVSTPEPPKFDEGDDVRNHKTDEAEAARNLERTKKDELDRLKREAEDLQKTLDADHGPEKEFYELRGKSISVQDKQYTYENQPFVDVKQKEGHSQTSLGNFEKFNENYTEMHYTGGQGCWQGPSLVLMIISYTK